MADAGAAAATGGRNRAWLPGREYDIVSEIGHGEGANSVVFHIRLRQPPHDEYALKMIKHFVGEEPSQRAGHAQSTMLVRGLGAEWREPMSLPPHDCLVPILHHYHADQPRLRDYVDPSVREAVADRTLFLVMPLYKHGSMRKALEIRRRSHPVAPFGLEWAWFGRQLLRMLRAVDHLISHNLVHGDIKDDQMFIDHHGQVVLGDFGTAWKLVDEDGLELRLRSRDELVERRAGVGPYKAPELRGRCHAHHSPLLKDVYAKAEGFSVGVLMYCALGCHYVDDVFSRLCDTLLSEERRVEKGMPPSRINDPTYGRKQPGWVYKTTDLPALPASTPGWLVEVVQGLVKSDHCEEERRLSPREAIQMLEVEGVARAWSELEDTRAQLTVLQQRIEIDRFSNYHHPQQPPQQVAASAEAAAQIQLLSEHLHAAKAAVQAAERQAEKFRQEGEIAMTELAKERAKLQVLVGAHENEQRGRIRAEAQLVQLQQTCEADQARFMQQTRTMQLEVQQLRAVQAPLHQQQQQQQQQCTAPSAPKSVRAAGRSGPMSPVRTNPFEVAAVRANAASQQQQQQPPPSYTPTTQEAPSGSSPLRSVTRDRVKRGQRSPPSGRKPQGHGRRWKKLDAADRPADPRFALALTLDRVPPPPSEILSLAGEAAAHARADMRQSFEMQNSNQVTGGAQIVGQPLTHAVQFLVRSNCTVREGPENSSAELGKHKEGAVIDVIREIINSKGIKVVWTTTYPAGWVKSVTSRGKMLLTPLQPASEPEPEPYQVGNTGITPRWCKKCKIVFMSASCPAQHANFMYTNHLPTSSLVTIATDPTNAAPAAAGTARSGGQTQLDYSPVLYSSSPACPNDAQTSPPAGHVAQSAEDDQWRKDLLSTLNDKLATRELLASEGVNAADLRVIDDEIAAIREARSEPF